MRGLPVIVVAVLAVGALSGGWPLSTMTGQSRAWQRLPGRFRAMWPAGAAFHCGVASVAATMSSCMCGRRSAFATVDSGARR